ncbi:MAG: aminoglycoside phosphotransferase family protein [Anaerolineales bacterium]|nr:aminoglycoside phosphotransferase family protein [Anaerolineales bacterium]
MAELPWAHPAAEWPFGRADLTAGLRRHLDDTSLQVEDVRPLTLRQRQPAIGRIRGLQVEYQARDGDGEVRLVLKEPHGSTRAGLAGAGRREVGFYRSLAEHVPLPTPDLVAFSPVGDWLILEYLDHVHSPDRWSREDYINAIDSLAELHDRFWSLRVDLEAFPWLGDPLASDFDVHLAAADKAIERITKAAGPEPLAGLPGRRWILERLAEEAERVVAPLRAESSTLLHGDFWPGNVAQSENGRQTVYDWQLAGIGPGIMDLLVFVNKSEWWYRPLPISRSEMVGRYRDQLEARGITWEDETWSVLWDHALMWRFVQEWFDLLAASPLPVLATRAEQLDQVWLQPVEDALNRRLGG